MTTVYHYTKGYNIPNIMLSGQILLEGQAGRIDHLLFKQNDVFGITPQVWLTTEREMPFTATSIIMDGDGNTPFRRYQLQRDRGYQYWVCHVGGVFRIAFDASEIDAQRYWYGQVREQLTQNGKRSVFERVAKFGHDDVRCWYHCSKPVPLTYKKSIETWSDGAWHFVTDNDVLELCN